MDTKERPVMKQLDEFKRASNDEVLRTSDHLFDQRFRVIPEPGNRKARRAARSASK